MLPLDFQMWRDLCQLRTDIDRNWQQGLSGFATRIKGPSQSVVFSVPTHCLAATARTGAVCFVEREFNETIQCAVAIPGSTANQSVTNGLIHFPFSLNARE